MKKAFRNFAAVIAILVCSQVSYGQAYDSSIGGRLGTFFTASYKKFVKDDQAIELLAGFDRVAGQSFLLAGAFYEIHNDLNFIEEPGFQWYYGAGGYVLLGDFTGIAPSGIVGVEYTLQEAPVNFFIDIIPSIFIGDGGSDFDINGAIGARYILSGGGY